MHRKRVNDGQPLGGLGPLHPRRERPTLVPFGARARPLQGTPIMNPLPKSATLLALALSTALAGFDASPARAELIGVRLPPRIDLPAPQIVDPLRTIEGTLSHGFTHDGRLDRAVSLPHDGPGHYVLHGHRGRDTHHATPALVDLLLAAANTVHAHHPDARIGIGNLSARQGGRFRWSRSHQNGRDADIAFVMRDPRGATVELNHLVRVSADADGHFGAGDLRFDVPANWRLVEGLLEGPGNELIQWIFVHAGLRRTLLDHADTIGACPQLRERAAVVLHQPGDSAPHDDHFHLRIACPPRDSLEGCVHWGPRRPWTPDMEAARATRVRRLIDALIHSSEGEDTTEPILAFLRAMHPRAQAEQIAAHVMELPPDAQGPALDLLARLEQPEVGPHLLPLLEGDTPLAVMLAVPEVLRRVGDSAGADPLARTVFAADSSAPLELQRRTATALGRLPADRSLPLLITARAHAPDPDLSEQVERALRIATGHRPPAGAQPDRWWASWCDTHCAAPRSEWLHAAFQEAGYLSADAPWGDVRTAQALLPALTDGREELAFNADRLLSQWLDVWSPLDGWSPQRRTSWWQRHLADRTTSAP